MPADAEPTTAYTNWPRHHGRGSSAGRSIQRKTRRTTGRPMDRVLLALRAYEQRAQRRAAMRSWLLARQTSVDPVR